MAKQKEKAKKNEAEEVVEETVEQEETAEEATESVENEAEETEVNEEITSEDKAKEWEDKYMRLYAEFDNYMKRTQREKDARYADAVIDTVSEILAVNDNLERALSISVETEEAKKVLEGVSLVKKQMDDILSKLGVTAIECVGEEFNPNLHNAVMHIEDENITDNTVVEEMQKGYIYKNERVVRYSMVKVAN